LFVDGKTQDVGGIPSDVVVLKNARPTSKEWYEGFEELRSIPHAFALVFANGETPIMLFSDSAPEKVWYLLASVSIADSLALGFALWPFNDMSMIVWTYDGVTVVMPVFVQPYVLPILSFSMPTCIYPHLWPYLL
jgi:hypothetical protein